MQPWNSCRFDNAAANVVRQSITPKQFIVPTIGGIYVAATGHKDYIVPDVYVIETAG